MSPHTLKTRKAIGAYYTPVELSQVLTDWCIRDKKDNVLEPSFGGCGFLETSVNRLEALGCKRPSGQVFGADIDEEAFKFLHSKLGSLSNIKKRFLCKDFLQTQPDDYQVKKFEAVLGNPPYISLHNMTPLQRKSCDDVLTKSPFSDGSMGRNTSLWAFFLLHSLSFLKNGGRFAWVLPSSLLHANYAFALRKTIEKYFSSVQIIKLNERFFKDSGADEVSVILLADNFNSEQKISSVTSFSVVECIDGLKTILFEKNQATNISTHSGNYKFNLLSPKVIKSYVRLQNSTLSRPLGELANVVIGMVTGDNKTFIVDEDTAKNAGLNEIDLKPVVSRFSQLSGLSHDKRRHKKAISGGMRCLLVCPENIDTKHTPIRNYLATISHRNRLTNKTFPKRANWYSPDDNRYPDAFLSYMVHKEPRMVLNPAKINCTNSIHRVFFNKDLSLQQKKAIAASFLSSFSLLSSELEGRSYGSGVLKLEPTPAKKITILFNEKIVELLEAQIKNIDLAIKEKSIKKAREIVDKTLSSATNIPYQDFINMGLAADILARERYKGLNKTI